jgi:hypothetical protein
MCMYVYVHMHAYPENDIHAELLSLSHTQIHIQAGTLTTQTKNNYKTHIP